MTTLDLDFARDAFNHARALERGEDTPHTDEEGYNGWSNRETWALALYLGNDQGTDEAAREAARDALHGQREDVEAMYGEEPSWTAEDRERLAQQKTADEFKEWVEDVLFVDLLDAATIVTWLRDIGSLWRVNWESVTKAFLEE